MAIFNVVQHGPVTEFFMHPTVVGRPMLPFRAYLVDGLLIDTGPPRMARQVGAMAREFPITQVVNTHHHEDHAGNNALIAELLGVPIFAHALSVPALARPARLPFYQRLVWGQPRASTVGVLAEVLCTPHHTFEVIHTPGHAADHVVLFERSQGWLFTGDLYIADKLKVLRRDEDVRLLTHSIGRVCTLPHATVFCAHRGVVEDGAALGRKRDYLQAFGEHVTDLVARGVDERAIARQLLGREDLVAAISAGDFTRQNLVSSFIRGPQARPVVR